MTRGRASPPPGKAFPPQRHSGLPTASLGEVPLRSGHCHPCVVATVPLCVGVRCNPPCWASQLAPVAGVLAPEHGGAPLGAREPGSQAAAALVSHPGKGIRLPVPGVCSAEEQGEADRGFKRWFIWQQS